MRNFIRRHGEKYTKIFRMNGGKTTYLKPMQHCCIHEGIDLINFPDFDEKHGMCGQVNKEGGASFELPKVLAHAA